MVLRAAGEATTTDRRPTRREDHRAGRAARSSSRPPSLPPSALSVCLTVCLSCCVFGPRCVGAPINQPLNHGIGSLKADAQQNWRLGQKRAGDKSLIRCYHQHFDSFRIKILLPKSGLPCRFLLPTHQPTGRGWGNAAPSPPAHTWLSPAPRRETATLTYGLLAVLFVRSSQTSSAAWPRLRVRRALRPRWLLRRSQKSQRRQQSCSRHA